MAKPSLSTLKHHHLRATARNVGCVEHWHKENALELNPPYQRGVVWGVKKQRALIQSLLEGIPIPSIIVNDRMEADWPMSQWKYTVIDGKQRLTAILNFVEGKYSVPGGWFEQSADWVFYPELPPEKQRKFSHKCLQFSEGRLATLAEEEEVFNRVNYGGLPQGEVDDDLI